MIGQRLQVSEHRLLLLVGDGVVTSVAVLLGLWIWSVRAGEGFSVAFLVPRAHWFASVPVWLIAMRVAAGWRLIFSVRGNIRSLARAAAALLGLYIVVYFNAPRELLPRLMAVYVLTAATFLNLGWRLIYIWIFTETQLRTKLLVYGAGAAGRAVVQLMKHEGLKSAHVVGFIDDDCAKHELKIEGIKVLGSCEHLCQSVSAERISQIILAVPNEITAEALRALLKCQEQGVELVQMATVYEDLLERVPVEFLEPDWLITSFVDAVRVKDASRLVKRLGDILGAFATALVLALVSPVVAAAIWLESGRPIFYSQVRVGKGGELFNIYKFRTMIKDAEGNGGARWTEPNDPRVTKIGRFLRRTRLDELPQTINVLRGQMSLVGPRPERPEFVGFLEQKIPFYRTRLIVKPGVTGWAQVNRPYGGSVADTLEKLEYDLYYIKRQTMLFDLRIVLQTIRTVLSFQGT